MSELSGDEVYHSDEVEGGSETTCPVLTNNVRWYYRLQSDLVDELVFSMKHTSFTVFTPTYNRAATIGRVFESLKSQTFTDFEWLIIDDGSTDDTEHLVNKWKKEAAFAIRYYKQTHGHKKTAFNLGVKKASGELFLPADSDDSFVPAALDILFEEWQAIPSCDRHRYAGVCGLCMDEDGKIVGDRFPVERSIDSNALEMKYRYRVTGEKWGFTRTDLLRHYPFPEYLPGHVPEGVVWMAIARDHATRFINRRLRIYHQNAGDQITRTSDPIKVAPGTLFAKRCILENEMKFFNYAPFSFFLDATRWTRFRLHINCQDYSQVRFWPRGWRPKILIAMCSPLGVMWWFVDRIRNR